MLVLTTKALGVYFPFPDWSGPRVAMSLGTETAEYTAEDAPIHARYLQAPSCVTEVLCDLSLWLGSRFDDHDQPLIYLDRKTDAAELRKFAEKGRNDPLSIQSSFDQEDRLVSLCLGNGIAQSPLFPEFLAFLRRQDTLSDRVMLTLLNKTFTRVSI